jgi:FkbM family methyltransferase
MNGRPKFSQNNEEEIIINLFNGKHNGVFMDIGSNDGVTLSNTFALAQYYGWTGLLVEASPKAYERMLKNYELIDRDFDFQCVAIGKEDKELLFYESGELLGKGDTSLVSSAVPYELLRWASIDMPFEKIFVPCTTVKTMLERSRHTHFDLLSLDIEGMELDVLPQIDFKALKIQVAVIEFNGKNEKAYNDIMFPQGFKLVSKNMENLIYTIFK